MSEVTFDDISEVREKTVDAHSLDEWRTAAKLNLFLVERLWNEVRKRREELIMKAPEVFPWNEDMDILKYRLKTLLKDNILEVTFTKVDGTVRTMKCTLKPTLLPEHEDTGVHHSVPEHILPVWDVEKNGWRSFRIDSVHDFVVTRK